MQTEATPTLFSPLSETSPSWQDELKQSLRNFNDWQQFLSLQPQPLKHNWKNEREKDWGDLNFPLFLTQRLAHQIYQAGPESSLALQYLPQTIEQDPLHQNAGLLDPIGDQLHQKTPQLIHRYKNRALLLTNTHCPVHCRFCFRQNELIPAQSPFSSSPSETLHYLQAHPEIEEVIFTGGDPLLLSDQKLAEWLSALSALPSIKWLRFHTRVPTVLPSRLTPSLSQLLKKFSLRFPLITLVIHTNHQTEWTFEAEQALEKFHSPCFQLLSQTVLLKGVNDSVAALKELWLYLHQRHIRPYYLHHPDAVKGGMHFRLSQTEGTVLMNTLRQELPGWILPHYVSDSPLGKGKSPLSESSFLP